MNRIWLARLESAFEKSIAIIMVLLIWEVLPRIGIVDSQSLPPFTSVIMGLFRLIFSGEIFVHLAVSLQRSLLGFVLSVAVALPLGIFMGWFKRFEQIVDPLLQVCRNTSVLALYPVFILAFGLGEFSKLAIIFWGTVWPILINTIEGVKGTDPLLIKAAKSMGASQRTLFLRIIFPSALPLILTGFRLSAARSVLILVAAEMLGADSGLAYLIFHSEEKLEIPEMYASIISIAILGLLINYILVLLEKRFTFWKEQGEVN